jgi:hypothetical protein
MLKGTWSKDYEDAELWYEITWANKEEDMNFIEEEWYWDAEDVFKEFIGIFGELDIVTKDICLNPII